MSEVFRCDGKQFVGAAFFRQIGKDGHKEIFTPTEFANKRIHAVLTAVVTADDEIPLADELFHERGAYPARSARNNRGFHFYFKRKA